MLRIKNIFFALYPKRLPKDRAVILMYHSISDRADYFASVSPANFARQMEYLAAQRMPVIALSELVRRLKSGDPLGGAAVITFDDGYRDNLTKALPILRTYGFPATVFITTGLLGLQDKRGLERLSAEDVRAMVSSGLIEFGAHTKTHPHLTRLSDAMAQGEIEDSKQTLESITGMPVSLFAAPYGEHNAAVDRLVRAHGFAGAAGVTEGTVGPGADPLALPRVSIDRSTTFAQFKGKLSTAVDVWEGFKLWKR